MGRENSNQEEGRQRLILYLYFSRLKFPENHGAGREFYKREVEENKRLA